MFWIYIIAGCFVALALLFIALHLIAKIRHNSIKSDFDIAY